METDSLKPSVALEANREAVRQAVQRFKAANPRVFGSVLYGTDQEGSDLDLLVDPLPGVTLFDLGGLQVAFRYTRRSADSGRSPTLVP